MLRMIASVVLALSTLTLAAPAEANWFKTAWHGFWRDYKRNVVWPEPFVQPDRDAVRAPFEVMIAKGWRMQNTLDDHHFDMQGARLNESGRLKVKTILEITPPQNMALFVLRGPTPELTAARIDAVQETVVSLTPAGQLPPVMETHSAPAGWSGIAVYAIDAKFSETTPEPRLPLLDNSDNSN